MFFVGGKVEEVRGMILLYLVPHMKGIGDSNEGYTFGMRELLHNLVVRYVARIWEHTYMYIYTSVMTNIK